MVDFHTQRPTMQLADPEDRALLGSNPSAAVGDGDNRRGVLPDAPAPFHISLVVLVRKAINPSFTATQLWLKLVSLTRPVCHLARSTGLRERLQRLLQLPLDQSFLQFVAFPPPETSATEATS